MTTQRYVAAPLLALAMAACSNTPVAPPSAGHLNAEAPLPAAQGTIPAPVQNTLSLPKPKPAPKVETYSVVVNNVRDRATDVVAGKRTLVVRLGRRFGTLEYAALWLVAWAVPLALAAAFSKPAMLLPLATAPFGARLIRTVATTEGRPLNATLAATAKMLLAYGALLTASLVAR